MTNQSRRTLALFIGLAVGGLILTACEQQSGTETATPAPAPGTMPGTDPGADQGTGQGTGHGSAASPPVATVPATPPADDTSMGPVLEDPADGAARIAKAETLIREMAAAYQAAPTMVDRIDVTTTMGGQLGAPSRFDITLGRGTDLSVVSEANEIVAVNGTLYFALTRIKDKYIALPLTGDMLTTLTKEFGAYRGVMVQPALRYGKPWPEMLYSLALGLPGTARPANYRVVTDNEGRQLEQLTLISEAGTGVIFVDPETKFIARAELEYIPPESPLPNFRVQRTFTFSPAVYDELPTPIAFDTTGRKAVTSLARLTGRLERDRPVEIAVAQGEMAPDFTLYTLAGEKRTLSEARGSVVVVTFWSTNIVGARTGLPVLSTYAQQRARTPKVVFWPVVTGTPNWDTAFEFWERHQIPFDCLIDRDNAVAELYDLPGLPLSVVIDAAGRLTEVVPRLDPGFTDDLEVAIMKAADATD